MAESKAGRTHPPALLKLVERAVRDHQLFKQGDTVLCACSGGPDSTALLHTLALLRKRLGHRLFAIGVDHGLRPGAADELSLAAARADELGVPFESVRVNVGAGSNLQARARNARLLAFFENARKIGSSFVATGHTADDRAETFCIRLLSGAGPKGLAVLPPKAPFPIQAPEPQNSPPLFLIRPLLQARRSDIHAHLKRHGLSFARDPSNEDPRFTRVRVRKELLPLMESLSPRIVEHLCALSQILAKLPEKSEEAPAWHEEPGLGRAQRMSIERAQQLGRRSHELLTQGGEAWLATFPEGKVVLTRQEPAEPSPSKAKGKAKIVK